MSCHILLFRVGINSKSQRGTREISFLLFGKSDKVYYTIVVVKGLKTNFLIKFYLELPLIAPVIASTAIC